MSGRTDGYYEPWMRKGRESAESDSSPTTRSRGDGVLDDDLKDALASEIISRLFIIHRGSEAEEARPAPIVRDAHPASVLRDNDRHRFLVAVRCGDICAANRQLDELIARQVSGRELLLSLLGGTAERLGLLWEEDDADFAEVTLALCNLHRLLRERSWTQGPEEHSPIVGLSLLMTTFADEQHVLGAMIVSEIFRRKGWSVTTLAGEPHTKVCAALRSDSYDVLGISAATVSNEKKAAEEIASLRAASCNPDLRVVVGGRAFAEEKELCMRIGADAIADSAEETTSWRPACS